MGTHSFGTYSAIGLLKPQRWFFAMRPVSRTGNALATLFALCTMLTLTQPLAAQSPEHGPLIVDLPASARAAALGNSFMLTSTDPEIVFYNPALLERAQGIGMGLHLYSTESTMIQLAGATSWGGGGVGFGLQVLEFGIADNDPLFTPGTEDDLLRAGPNGISEFVATIGYARQYFGFRWGANVKAINRRAFNTQDGVIALDLATSRAVGPVTVGLSVQNLGENLKLAGRELPLAERITLAATTRTYPVGGLDVAATASITRRADVEVIPAGGIEVSWWPVTGRTFTGRLGLQRVPRGDESPVTFGAGFRGDDIGLDYTFQSFGDLDPAHRIGISFR